MKIIETISNKIVEHIFAYLISLVLSGAGSIYFTGRWIETIAVILPLGLVVIFKRIREVRNSNTSSFVSSETPPRLGWKKIKEEEYKGVIWEIRKRIDSYTPLEPEMKINVKTPPSCPKCKTEIEQTRSFWGGYVWKCINEKCGFKKRNKESYYQEAKRVKSLYNVNRTEIRKL